MTRIAALSLTFAALLAACGESQSPSPSQGPGQGPEAKAAAAPAAALTAPAGDYQVDPHHSSLAVKIKHLGLADYVMRFTSFQADLKLDPAQVGNSSVSVTIDPTSVRTDFAGDFKATHPDSPYGSFDERVSRDAPFLNSDQFKTITFKSTKVEPAGDGKLRVTGDLTFLGQTHPVTLETTVAGSMEQHPFTKRGAVGFAATMTFTRSDWAMTGTQQFLSDAVTVEFNGEFHQAAPQEPAPTTPN